MVVKVATPRTRKPGGKAKKATVSRPPPSLIIPDEEEVVKVPDCPAELPDNSDTWVEKLDREPLVNRFCDGCPLGTSCVITRIAVVMFCHRKFLDNS
jgi:hypothetical protein